VDIDLDTPPPPPPTRPRRTVLLLAAATAVVAAGVVAVRLTAPDPDPGNLTATWTADLPASVGHAVMTRVRGTVVLVVAQKGLVALDRASGAELWHRDLADEVGEFGPNGLGVDTAADFVQLSGDAIVIPRFDPGEPPYGPRAFDVLDLATGATRFTASAGGPDVEVGGYATVTTTALIVQVPDVYYQLRAYALADGRELWRTESPDGPVLPRPHSVRNQLVAVPSTGPVLLEPPVGEYFLLASFVEGPEHRLNVVVHSALDGSETSRWYVEGAEDSPSLEIVGDRLIDKGARENLYGLDLLTGSRSWEVPTFYDFFEPASAHVWTLAGGLLVDSAREENAEDPGRHQRIDLATGTVEAGAPVGGRRLIAVGAGFAVGLGDGELTAVSTDGTRLWTRELEEGFVPGGFLVGDGRLVLDGGAVGDPGALWVVGLDDGRADIVPGGVLNGWEEGALVSVTDAAPSTVRLDELGV